MINMEYSVSNNNIKKKKKKKAAITQHYVGLC